MSKEDARLQYNHDHVLMNEHRSKYNSAFITPVYQNDEYIQKDDDYWQDKFEDDLEKGMLDDDLGKEFAENRNRINNLTIKRNNSILAHGLESLDKDDFDQFEELVESLALKLDKDMKKFLNETRFAKFDLKVKINRI